MPGRWLQLDEALDYQAHWVAMPGRWSQLGEVTDYQAPCVVMPGRWSQLGEALDYQVHWVALPGSWSQLGEATDHEAQWVAMPGRWPQNISYIWKYLLYLLLVQTPGSRHVVYRFYQVIAVSFRRRSICAQSTNVYLIGYQAKSSSGNISLAANCS